MPAVGFGFGDAVIVELLKAKHLLPDVKSPKIDVVVYAMNEELRPAAVKIAQTIRELSIKCDLVLEEKKLKWAIKHGERIGATTMVIVAPDEYAQKQVVFKDLSTGQQSNVSLEGLAAAVTRRVATTD